MWIVNGRHENVFFIIEVASPAADSAIAMDMVSLVSLQTANLLQYVLTVDLYSRIRTALTTTKWSKEQANTETDGVNANLNPYAVNDMSAAVVHGLFMPAARNMNVEEEEATSSSSSSNSKSVKNVRAYTPGTTPASFNPLA